MKSIHKSLPLLITLGTTLAFAQSTTTIPQVKHVILVIQENRTPTNLFHQDQTLITNGAHVRPAGDAGTCGPTPPPSPQGSCPYTTTNSTSVALAGVSLALGPGAGHEHYPSWYCTYDGGAMDGACHNNVNNPNNVACPDGNLQFCPYTYVNQTGLLAPYFNIADQYGFANWMFQTHQGPSQPAHLFLFDGTSAPDMFQGDAANFWEYFVAENGNGNGCLAALGATVLELPPAPPQNRKEVDGYTPPGANPGYPCWNPSTLASVLDNAKVTWRYYDAADGLGIWNAPVEIQSVCGPPLSTTCTGSDYINNVRVGNPGLVLQDLGAVQNKPCDLQGVTWVIPDGNWSDHPGNGSMDAGPSWVAAIVNAVNGFNNDGTSLPNQCKDPDGTPYWKDTVVVVTWDDWGGFYDDVLPWRCDGTGVCSGYPNAPQSANYVYGFRVPLLVVGAYVKQVTPQGGYISGSCSPSGTSCKPAVPFVHDFGSILSFVEAAFGLPEISPSYHYADYLAPDAPNSPGCTPQLCPYGLSDFFNFGQTARSPILIKGAKYDTSCFLNPSSCFGASYPAPPDDDNTSASD